MEEAVIAYGKPAPRSGFAKANAKTSGSTGTLREQSRINDIDVDVLIFTDGGCEPNPGEAGSGIAVYQKQALRELWYGLYVAEGTNNIAELNALNQGFLLAADELKKNRSVAVFSDSTYSINCITKWASGWEKKGWKRDGNQPIKNLELIQEAYANYNRLKDKVQVLHVKGHAGIEGNELADRMSMFAVRNHEDEFARYQDELNISEILAMAAG